ncbi:MAG: thiamine phosphate synthase [Phycisphaerae bacterium]|nr:thiamine phosphate synthase [Phycisphaerae bacterium]
MRKIYRILDANFNRAREALRVIEDFARFVLDDAGLSASAKDMRSRLRQSMGHFPADAMLAARDTPGDVGTTITSATETDRPDAASVATAACKRLTESLRTLEEYAKVANPASAGEFESMRYAAYTLEQRLALRLAGSERFNAVRLYVLLTSHLCKSDPIVTAQAAITGGADCIQVREKEMPDRKLLAHARCLREITQASGVLLIINDRPDIAAIVGADGVHLGQDDMPVVEARRSLGEGGAIVGVSTHNISQARAAAADGADYIGVGPMFPTTTKDAGPIAGVGYLKQVVTDISLPHVAIGGITVGNVGELVTAGACRVAVCSAVIAAADPAAAAAEIKEQLTT